MRHWPKEGVVSVWPMGGVVSWLDSQKERKMIWVYIGTGLADATRYAIRSEFNQANFANAREEAYRYAGELMSGNVFDWAIITDGEKPETIFVRAGTHKVGPR